MVALIVSKLVLVVVFLIAITQVATPIEADLSAVTEPISGIVLLFIAAFAPYMVYRFILLPRLRPLPRDGHRAGSQERPSTSPSPSLPSPSRTG